jgi:hypothetical protein
MNDLAFERFESGKLRPGWVRQDTLSRNEDIAGLSPLLLGDLVLDRDSPLPGLLVPNSTDNPRIQLDVLIQAPFSGCPLNVVFDLGAASIEV